MTVKIFNDGGGLAFERSPTNKILYSDTTTWFVQLYGTGHLSIYSMAQTSFHNQEPYRIMEPKHYGDILDNLDVPFASEAAAVAYINNLISQFGIGGGSTGITALDPIKKNDIVGTFDEPIPEEDPTVIYVSDTRTYEAGTIDIIGSLRWNMDGTSFDFLGALYYNGTQIPETYFRAEAPDAGGPAAPTESGPNQKYATPIVVLGFPVTAGSHTIEYRFGTSDTGEEAKIQGINLRLYKIT